MRFLIHGLILMERGYIFTCMILAAVSALLIDRKFQSAAVWSLAGAAFAAIGLTHAYSLSGNNVDYLFAFADAPDKSFNYRSTGVAIGYLFFAAVFLLFGEHHRRNPDAEGGGH